MPDYLTTGEVARYLRLNQRKIHALATAGEIPAARVSGKWLFPEELVDEWVRRRTVDGVGGLEALLDRVVVMQGSDDWLLSRIVDRFQQRFATAIPMATVGSLAGLSAIAARSAHVASCHVPRETVREHAPLPLHLVSLFSREQGILLARGRRGIDDLESLARQRLRFARRQAYSGTFRLVERLLAEKKLVPRWIPIGPLGSHLEVAHAIATGRADAGIGIRVAAELAGLRFVPLAREQFDLAIPTSFMSHARIREFLEFIVVELEAEGRGEHRGYGFESLGRSRTV
jgi:putative molybdopterin biosynthesis protein